VIAPPKPGTDLWRVLATVAAHDGELDARAIAGVLWPYHAPDMAPVLAWSPAGASAALAAWRASVQGRRLAEERHWREATERAATCLQRLTSIGMVVPARSCVPELSPWFVAMAAEVGDREAVRRAVEAGESRLLDDADEEEREGYDAGRVLAMVAQVRSGPGSASDLLGAGSGETKRCYSLLIESGIVVPPTYRRVTEKGRAWLAGIALVQGAV
jgi:hypothetical protein